jgi:hypothetical protein
LEIGPARFCQSIPKTKGRAQKTSIPKPVAPQKGKKSGTQTVLDMIKKSKTGIAAGSLIKKNWIRGQTDS